MQVDRLMGQIVQNQKLHNKLNLDLSFLVPRNLSQDAPALGAQNEEVFNDLGVSSEELKNLKRQGII